MRRAARNDGWLGLPLDRAAARPLVSSLRKMRREAGLAPEGMAVCIALTEPHEPQAIAELEDMGVTALMIMSPWLPNPFFNADWYDEREDPRDFETKRRAIARFAEQVIR